MVTNGVIAQWGGTTLLLKGMDLQNSLVGNVIVDGPDNELATDPENDERLENKL